MEKTEATKPTQKKKVNTFLFQIIMITTLLSLIWFSFGQNVLSLSGRSGLPQRFGDLKIVSSIEGAEAIRQVSQLHGTEIDIKDASIATYAGNNEKAEVWIGDAQSTDAAKVLVDRMIAGISKGNTGFTNLKNITVTQGYHSHEVFQVDGQGGQHFFYISKKFEYRVVWITVESEEAMKILEQAIQTF